MKLKRAQFENRRPVIAYEEIMKREEKNRRPNAGQSDMWKAVVEGGLSIEYQTSG